MHNLIFFLCFFILLPSILSGRPKFLLITENGQLITLNSLTKSTNWIFILFNNYNCVDCVKELDTCLKRIQDTNLIKGVIVRCENNVIAKKEILAKIQKNLIGYSFFFDYHKLKDPWPPCNLKEGIFGYYKICQSPSILLANKYSIRFISYKDLFGKKLSVDSLLRNEIFNFFYRNE